MTFILSYNNNEWRQVFPVVPNSLTNMDYPQDNSSFDSLNGEMNVIGPMGLRSFKLTSIFPTHSYPWINADSTSDGWGIVDAIEAGRKKYIPFRAILLRPDGGEVFNMPVTVDKFSYAVDKAGDIPYTLELREYRFASYTR